MPIVADRPGAPTAIQTDLAAIFISLELSRSIWLMTSLSPGGGQKMSKLCASRGRRGAVSALFGAEAEGVGADGKLFSHRCHSRSRS
jgi:transposase